MALGLIKTNWKVWLYDYGIEKIERAYNAARSALDDEIKSVQVDFDKHIAAHGPDTDYADHLIDMHTQADDSLKLVREAFALALHHYWEKKSNEWTGVSRYQYKQAHKELAKRGYLVEKVGLGKLRKTANTIKHDSDELYKQYKGMFDKSVARDIKNGDKPDYHDNLILTDADMQDFLRALKASGPTRATKTK